MVLYRDLQVAVTWPQKVKKNARKEKLAPAAALIVEPPWQGPVAWEVEMSKGPSRQKKKRRAVQRQAKAQSLAPSKYVNLRMASVSNATLKRYQQVKGDFVGWQRKKKIKDKFKALESYLEHLYLRGEDLSLGTYTVAALVHFEPEMKSHPIMPRAQQTLKGWRKMCTPRSRMPLPYEVVCLVAVKAIEANKPEIALALLLTFFLYLRPTEFETLRTQDIVRPVKGGKEVYRHWSILLHPMEEGVPSKTLQWDESLTLDLEHMKQLGPAMGRVLGLQRRPKNQLSFTTSSQEVTEFMKHMWPQNGLQPIGEPHMYRLRRGGHLRVSKQAPLPSRSPTSRKMEGFEEPEKLRKRRATGTNVRQPQRGHTATVHRGGAKPRSAPAQPALKPQCSLKLPVFLEIFSGSGRLGRAVGRVVGIAVLLWDINFGPEYDLTNPSIQQRVMEWIRIGYVVAGHLGTPCGSFSRARDRPGGPPRLRSDDCPLGLEGLKPHDAQKVAVGNILMRFTVRVMLLSLRMILPFTLENPVRSRLWLCPPIRALLRRKHVRVQQVEYCSFGMPWKKSTLFVAVHLVLHTLEPYRCIGAKRGLCKYSGHAHVPLAGQLPDGRWMTHVAEPYPNKLCTVLAGCFRDFYVSRIADNLAQHL